jgi:hypothetical protein
MRLGSALKICGDGSANEKYSVIFGTLTIFPKIYLPSADVFTHRACENNFCGRFNNLVNDIEGAPLTNVHSIDLKFVCICGNIY